MRIDWTMALSHRFFLCLHKEICLMTIPVFYADFPKACLCRYLTIVVVCLTSSFVHAQFRPLIKKFFLGQDSVRLAIYDAGGKNFAFVHVHENEEASLQAGLTSLAAFGGKLITLQHSRDGSTKRNVTFRHNKTTFSFDPNRIFTHDRSVLAASITVIKGKGKADNSVIEMVDALARAIWDELAGYPLIIALHNNKNKPSEYSTRWLFFKHYEPESYSITSYVRKFDQVSDSNKSCSDIYINPAINNSEFFIVTRRSDFDQLLRLRYNVVLQNDRPVDDGSMSVLAAKNGIRYINAEAKHGRITEQTAMLRLLLDAEVKK